VKYPRAVDRIPYAAMLETRDEIEHPPVRRFRFPIRTRWLIVTMRTRTTWSDVWRDVRYLLCG
jgi:hypothetical protein